MMNKISDGHGVVTIEGNTAYLNVPALMRMMGVEDTEANRHLAAASVCAVLREQGYNYVLVGIDEATEEVELIK